MRHRLNALGSCAVAVLAAAATSADAKVRLLEAGIVCPEPRDGAARRAAPDTEIGHIDILERDVGFDLLDRQVPAMRDLAFGLRVALKAGQPETALTIVLEHPPLGDRAVTRQSWVQWVAGGEDTINLFTFDFPYEMVEGDWAFSIEVEGQRVVSVPFDVGPPGSNPRVDEVCFVMSV